MFRLIWTLLGFCAGVGVSLLIGAKGTTVSLPDPDAKPPLSDSAASIRILGVRMQLGMTRNEIIKQLPEGILLDPTMALNIFLDDATTRAFYDICNTSALGTPQRRTFGGLTFDNERLSFAGHSVFSSEQDSAVRETARALISVVDNFSKESLEDALVRSYHIAPHSPRIMRNQQRKGPIPNEDREGVMIYLDKRCVGLELSSLDEDTFSVKIVETLSDENLLDVRRLAAFKKKNYEALPEELKKYSNPFF